MAHLNNELAIPAEAVDWDLWIQDDHAALFQEEHFHPDFDSPPLRVGGSRSPTSAVGGEVSPGCTSDSRASDTLFSCLGFADNYYSDIDLDFDINFDIQFSPTVEDTRIDSKSASTSVLYDNISQQSSPASTLSPRTSISIHCDWPTCARILSSRSAYKFVPPLSPIPETSTHTSTSQHYKNHIRPFKCQTCGVLKATITHLRRHVNERHHATRRYYCSVPGCGRQRKCFLRRDNLKRHMKQVHGGVGGR